MSVILAHPNHALSIFAIDTRLSRLSVGECLRSMVNDLILKRYEHQAHHACFHATNSFSFRKRSFPSSNYEMTCKTWISRLDIEMKKQARPILATISVSKSYLQFAGSSSKILLAFQKRTRSIEERVWLLIIRSPN